MVEDDLGALDKKESLTPASDNVTEQAGNTWEHKISRPERKDDSNRREWESEDNEVLSRNIGCVLTLAGASL